MWERACSRKRFNRQHSSRLTLRIREQARSHIGSAAFLTLIRGILHTLNTDAFPCW
ncbi:hypothetical protein EMIT0P43_10733 [Pseudomonas jessenii]